MGKRKVSFNDSILRRKFLIIEADKNKIIIRVYIIYFRNSVVYLNLLISIIII